MAHSTTLTLRETAFVFGDKLRNIVRAVEEHSSLGLARPSGTRALRVLGMPDLIYIQALNEMGELLSPKGRLQLHQALLTDPARDHVLVGNFSLAVHQLQNSVERRLDALAKLKDGVEGDPDDPLIKGTRVEVYRVSALIEGGASVQTALRDYPSLTAEQVELATEYAQAIPKKGRPYPRTSFKRALAGLDLSALEDVLGDDGADA